MSCVCIQRLIEKDSYIKELAARLNSLESQLGPQSQQMNFQGVPFAAPNAAETAPMIADQQTNLDASRKRTHSDMQGNLSDQTSQLLSDRPDWGMASGMKQSFVNCGLC